MESVQKVNKIRVNYQIYIKALINTHTHMHMHTFNGICYGK